MAGSDSGVYLGRFNAADKKGKEIPEHAAPQENLLGVLIEGPSRVGHYVRPAYRTSKGVGGIPDRGGWTLCALAVKPSGREDPR